MAERQVKRNTEDQAYDPLTGTPIPRGAMRTYRAPFGSLVPPSQYVDLEPSEERMRQLYQTGVEPHPQFDPEEQQQRTRTAATLAYLHGGGQAIPEERNEKIPVSWAPRPEMSAYDPSIRENLTAALMGDQRQSVPSENFRRGMASLIGMTPANIPMAAQEAGRALASGDVPGGAFSALGATGGLPGKAAHEAYLAGALGRAVGGGRAAMPIMRAGLPALGIPFGVPSYRPIAQAAEAVSEARAARLAQARERLSLAQSNELEAFRQPPPSPADPEASSIRRSIAEDISGEGYDRNLGGAEREVPMPRQIASATHEQVPGASTGLRPDVLNAPYAEKERFTEQAPWIKEGGEDPIYKAMGAGQEPAQKGTGVYVSPTTGRPEFSPVGVSRAHVWTELDPRGDWRVPDPEQARLNAAEASRALIDFQEGGAWNKVIPGEGPGRSSVSIDLGRQPTQDEIRALHGVADKHGFVMANAENGVSFMNFNPKDTSETVGTRLLGDLGKDIQTATPEAEVAQGALSSGYTDYSKELAKEQAGKGLATQKWQTQVGALKAHDPEAYEGLMASPEIAEKARANLARIGPEGAAQRPDYVTMLSTIGEGGGLGGLQRRIASMGYSGLPALAGATVLGAQYGQRPEDEEEEQPSP